MAQAAGVQAWVVEGGGVLVLCAIGAVVALREFAGQEMEPCAVDSGMVGAPGDGHRAASAVEEGRQPIEAG